MIPTLDTSDCRGNSCAKPFMRLSLIVSILILYYILHTSLFQTAREFVSTIRGRNHPGGHAINLVNLLNMCNLPSSVEKDNRLLSGYSNVRKVRLDIKQGDALVLHHIHKTGKILGIF